MTTNDEMSWLDQILPTSNIRNIRRIVRKIWMLILGLKGIKQFGTKPSLRSKRFRRAFHPLEAFVAFWLRKNWGERFFASAPIFPRPKKRKVHRTCGKPYRNACYAGNTRLTIKVYFTEREDRTAYADPLDNR